jgi:hypothetical protein
MQLHDARDDRQAEAAPPGLAALSAEEASTKLYASRAAAAQPRQLGLTTRRPSQGKKR